MSCNKKAEHGLFDLSGECVCVKGLKTSPVRVYRWPGKCHKELILELQISFRESVFLQTWKLLENRHYVLVFPTPSSYQTGVMDNCAVTKKGRSHVHSSLGSSRRELRTLPWAPQITLTLYDITEVDESIFRGRHMSYSYDQWIGAFNFI